jgi:hypothetical protein
VVHAEGVVTAAARLGVAVPTSMLIFMPIAPSAAP